MTVKQWFENVNILDETNVRFFENGEEVMWYTVKPCEAVEVPESIADEPVHHIDMSKGGARFLPSIYVYVED